MWRIASTVALIALSASGAGGQNPPQRDPNPYGLSLGPIDLSIKKTPGKETVTTPPLDRNTFLTDLYVQVDGQTKQLSLRDKTPTAAAALINSSEPNLTADVQQKNGILQLQIRSKLPGKSVVPTQPDAQTKLVPATFTLELPDASLNKQVTVRYQDGSVIHLNQRTSAPVDAKTQQMAVVSVGDPSSTKLCPGPQAGSSDNQGDCYNEYLLIYSVADDKLVLGAYMQESNPSSKTPSDPATNPPVLEVEKTLANESESAFFLINGRTWITPAGPSRIGVSQDAWRIDRYPKMKGCRAYSKDETQHTSAVIQPPRRAPLNRRPNGIVVGYAKLFDVAALTRMLNDTANQLAAITGFNAAPIAAAYGNLQGIMRDTSYLNVQATTAATPGISQTLSSGATTPNTTSTTAPVGQTTVTLQCPDGSLPTIGSSNTLGGCTAVPITSTAANQPGYAPVTAATGAFQGQLTTVPAGTTTTNTGTTATTQNGTTITTPSVSGAAPAALTATPLTPPANVGYGSADILAEQVQINSQLTMYRLLLQGALSDQYLLRNSRAVAVRQQTTVGFTVSLDPPRQFRHAVAEVRIIIAPPAGQDKVSIMNLLPSEKTYNVAKVSSRQDAFGAGAVVEPVSLGVSTGRSKDRLYLAKDTDTIALQFPGGDQSVPRPLPQFAHDLAKSVEGFQILGACAINEADEKRYDLSDATQFGWQFRPVLGADYVRGGQRQVFAQLALPAGLEDQYLPKVLVETLWRAYDPKRQVVGAVYSSSCTKDFDMSGVVFANQPKVRNVEVTDLGAGQLKLTAKGDFYSSGLNIRAGAANFAPTFFDGKTLELIGSAHDLLEAGDLNIIGPNGQPHSLSVSVFPDFADACKIESAEAAAVPRPDGNSRVEMTVTVGGPYNPLPNADGDLNPLVLIGNQVYGVKESPFLGSQCYPKEEDPTTKQNRPAGCKFAFIAPTASLRNAQAFIVRDLAWQHMEKSGRLGFAPSITSMALLTSPPDTAKETATDLYYTISGFDLSKAGVCRSTTTSASASAPTGSANPPYCVEMYAGGESLKPDDKGWQLIPVTDNTAIFHAPQSELAKLKKLRFVVQNSADACAPSDEECVRRHVEWDLDVTLPQPGGSTAKTLTSSPPFLSTGDSRKVVFTGPDFSDVDAANITFEGKKLLVPATYNAKDHSLQVTITSDITSKPGHKELTAPMKPPSDPAAPAVQPLQLPVEVVRR